MTELRRRRTKSDADLTKSIQMPLETNQPGSRKRRSSNARQAKLLGFPFRMQNGIPQQASLPSRPACPLPPAPPKMTSNSIHFSIPPSMGNVCYMFAICLKPWQRVIFSGPSLISFAINQQQYDRVIPPLDVTGSIFEGENHICFIRSSTDSSTMFVEMHIENIEDVDVLTRNIVETQKAQKKNLSGPASEICPISGHEISLPGRGENCMHNQAFDIKSFIAQRTYVCPICHDFIPYNQVVYDEYYMKEQALFKLDNRKEEPENEMSIFEDFNLNQYDALEQLFNDRDF